MLVFTPNATLPCPPGSSRGLGESHGGGQRRAARSAEVALGVGGQVHGGGSRVVGVWGRRSLREVSGLGVDFWLVGCLWFWVWEWSEAVSEGKMFGW